MNQEGMGMLDFDSIDWDDDDVSDPDNNVRHIAAAGLTPEEVNDVLYSPDPDTDTSDHTGRPAVFGWTATGTYIIVVYEIDEDSGVVVIRPKTAYEVPPPL
jgi:hypothetical protein